MAITVPLTWLWMSWGREAYAAVFEQLATPIYDLLGLRTIRPSGVHERFLNYLPFFVLMLLTPRLSPLRRTLGLLIGSVVLFLFHVGFAIATSWGPRAAGSMTESAFQISFPAYIISDSLPFLLWIVIAHEVVGEMAEKAMSQMAPRAPAAPDSGAP
jgi:hypothetical protein